MLGETIVTLRKKQALSQQQLADRMHVVRQTVSKWEKNLSVPDADALVRLADALDVSVAELLGQPVKEETAPAESAVVLAQINEQLAIQNRRRSRVWKTAAWILGVILAIYLLLFASAAMLMVSEETAVNTVEETEYTEKTAEDSGAE